MTPTRRVAAALAAAGLFATGVPRGAEAGGSGANVVVIVDPASAEAREVGGYYAAARGVPAANLLAMAPGADAYVALAEWQLPAFLDTMESRGIADHIDYVVLPPGSPFYVAAPGLVSPSGCPSPFRRIALPSAYTLAFEAERILAGGLTVEEENSFFSAANAPMAFDSRTGWRRGQPSPDAGAPRYYIGMALGYSGAQGNTVAETRAMIDSSVAAEGTMPDGTFYFMKSGDPARSGPREMPFQSARAALEGLGAKAEILDGVLPDGRDDVIGIMTGHAAPPIEAADMVLLPGAWGDHLTSFAATFDAGQAKVSSWIRKGASGSFGTVEEPCNYPGKFPHPRMFVWYRQGMSLGESLFRSLAYAPFHGMPYGDPLTQPYAAPPQLAVDLAWPADPAPPAEVAGVLEIPVAASVPGGSVAAVEVFVDGVRVSGLGTGPGESGGRAAELAGTVRLDTTSWSDGDHELTVLAVEGSAVRSQASWRRRFTVDNLDRPIDVQIQQRPAPDGSMAWSVEVTAPGADEIRVLEARRVIAAGAPADGAAQFILGKDPRGPLLAVEAEYADGKVARWLQGESLAAPVGVPLEAAQPTAFGYHADLVAGQTAIVDLPVGLAGTAEAEVVAEVVAPPGSGEIHLQGSTAFLRSPPGVRGVDHIVFRARAGDAVSEPATVTLRYCDPPSILVPPRGLDLCPGRGGSLRVIAAGANLTYQWTKDGGLVQGATGPELELSRADAGTAGAYSVTVRSWCGSVGSAVASEPVQVTVGALPDSCATHLWIPFAERP